MDQIWEQLVKKDPKLSQGDHEVTFTATHLKQLLQQVYYQGGSMAINQSTTDPLLNNKNMVDQMNDLLGKDFWK